MTNHEIELILINAEKSGYPVTLSLEEIEQATSLLSNRWSLLNWIEIITKMRKPIFEHSCPDWDFMVINELTPEIIGCTCTKPIEGERKCN